MEPRATVREESREAAALAALAEPTRRRLFELVASSADAVARDEAAAAVGITRELAAFHLDRLVAAGLLVPEYRRRSGRSGPGAGRPAKLYRRAADEVSVSVPPRRYGLAARLFAEALDAPGQLSAGTRDALLEAARRDGAAATRAVPSSVAGTRPPVIAVLERAGYEPDASDPSRILLKNCPFRGLIEQHRDLTCHMNLAWVEGALQELGGTSPSVEFAPGASTCCVSLVTAPPPATK